MQAQALADLDQREAAVTEEGIDPSRNLLGLPETALTLGTGTIGFATSVLATPFIAAANYALGNDIFKTADHITELQQRMTITPFSEQGKVAMESLMAPMVALDDVAYQSAGWLGQGEPWAEALLYGMMNTAMVVTGSEASTALKMGKRGREIQAIAKELGIDLKSADMPAQVIAAVERMAPRELGENAPALRTALQQSKELKESVKASAAAASADAVELVAKQTGRANSPTELAAGIRQHLVDSGVNLGTMPRVEATLSRIANGMEGPQAIVSEAAASRIARGARRRNKEFDPADEALAKENVIMNRVTRLEREWRKGDMIDGMADAARNHRGAAKAKIKKEFNPDDYLVKMLNDNATPEMINRWTFGSGKNGFSPEAGAVVKRIKDVLGEDSPAFRGLQQDFLYRVAEPLLRETPDFKVFLSNFDDFIRNQPTIVAEMGLKASDLNPLRDFARLALRDKNRGKIQLMQDGVLSLSRFVAGNALARNAVKVNTVANAMKLLVGQSKNTQLKQLAELSQGIYNQPLVSAGSVQAGRIVQGAVLTDMEAVAKEMKDEELSFDWLREARRLYESQVE
jgi:hypothetical protein